MPKSGDEVWKANIPHTHLAHEKSDQNWMVDAGEKIMFPGCGTHFHYSTDKYIASIAKVNHPTNTILIYLIKVWVMNVVPQDGLNTLKLIYVRGLIGSTHDWMSSQRILFRLSSCHSWRCLRF